MLKIISILIIGALIITTLVLTSCKQSKKNKNSPNATIGSIAPNFSLQDQDGKTHILARYKGKKIALYFYPKDESPNCTKQACSLRDGYSELKEQGIVLLGVSFDSASKHQKFSTKHKLPFPILSDHNKTVTKQYNAVQNLLVVQFPKRLTYLINKDGLIVDIIKNPNVKNHAQQIIDRFNQI
jgi:peroxiredoxin Q/BCP